MIRRKITDRKFSCHSILKRFERFNACDRLPGRMGPEAPCIPIPEMPILELLWADMALPQKLDTEKCNFCESLEV